MVAVVDGVEKQPLPAFYLVDAVVAAPAAGTGRLNATLEVFLDPKEEFKQIFYEGWRDQRDCVRPNMHRADWPRHEGSVRPVAALCDASGRSELLDRNDMMGSEDPIGHSYVRGGDMPSVPNSRGGLLGADFAIENGRYKITKVYDTESWNPDLHAPSAPGVDVSVGNYLVATRRTAESAGHIYRLLDGTSNQRTVLSIKNLRRWTARIRSP